MNNIFPNPTECHEKEGEFRFADQVYLILDEQTKNPDFVRFCPILWKQFTANRSTLTVCLRKGMGNHAFLSTSQDASLPVCDSDSFEYALEVTDSGVAIAFSQAIGLIHAFSTLLQCISPYHLSTNDFTVCACLIKDRPALAFRGMHLMITPETSLVFLRKMILLLGLLKCTHVTLEAWGMIASEVFPPIGWKEAYTKEQLAPILADGRALGIEFIPMFNHLGHASYSRFRVGKHVVLDQEPQYEELFTPGGWTWDIQNPCVEPLQQQLREELCDILGEGSYFHIGCDEAYATDGRHDGFGDEENDAFLAFLSRTTDRILDMGRTPILWGDMFLDKSEYAFPYCANVSNHYRRAKENLQKLHPAAIIDDWQYNIKGDRAESVELFLQSRDPQKMILSPWDDFENIAGRCALAKKYGLLGILGTTWNTIYNDPKFLTYTACLMWDKDASYTDLCHWETLKVMTAQYLRKLCPVNGDYKTAGFMEKEIFSPV